MKKLITLLISLIPSIVFAQSMVYGLDTLRRDSFFLVETITQPVEGSPRPNTTVNYQLFRSREQLELFASNLRKESEKYERLARIQKSQADVIQSLVIQNAGFFDGDTPKQPSVSPPMQANPEPDKKPSKKRRKKT